jgi:DNA-binding MarR family transcriptional regulator
VSVDTPRQAAAADQGVRWLSAEQLHEWQSLVTLLMTLPAAMDGQLRRDAGVNLFEYHVLAALSDAPDRTLVLSDLAGLAQGSLSRLSHAVTRLERAGWVVRRSCGNGGSRRTEALLTDAGWAKLEEIAPGHVGQARRLVVDALSPQQLTALGDAARTITAAIAAQGPHPCGEPAADPAPASVPRSEHESR